MKRFMIATLIVLVMIVIGGVASVLRDGNEAKGSDDVIPDNAWDAPTQNGNAAVIARKWLRTARRDANDYVIENVIPNESGENYEVRFFNTVDRYKLDSRIRLIVDMKGNVTAYANYYNGKYPYYTFSAEQYAGAEKKVYLAIDQSISNYEIIHSYVDYNWLGETILIKEVLDKDYYGYLQRFSEVICAEENELLRLTVPEEITRIDFWYTGAGLIMQVDDRDTIEQFSDLLRRSAGTEGDPEEDDHFYLYAVYCYCGDQMCADYHIKFDVVCGYVGGVKTLIRLSIDNPLQEYIDRLFDEPYRWPVQKIPE
ncbi:MAG: hypothetical protein J5649_10240 [Lachnospiraceae bacterium]|nr:hypothetical protein [Lachnospiraceae bacterium]